MRKILLLFLLVSTSLAFAQLESIYFNSKQFSISDSSKLKLEKFYGDYLTGNNPQIIIKGYSDSSGTKELNLKISKQRVETINDFLLQKGYSKEKIKLEYYGEAGLSDNTSEKSRRVDLYVNSATALFDIPKKYLPATQTFTINNNRDTTLYSTNNTLLFIPENSFDNSENDKILKINFIEYLKPQDIILSNLSSQTDKNQILETAGMFKIKVVSNEKECQIKNTSSILIGIPKIIGGENYKLYNGINNEEHIVWDSKNPKKQRDNGLIQINGISHQKQRALIYFDTDSVFNKYLQKNLKFPIKSLKEGFCGPVNFDF
jgi:hypothetical protein